MSGDFSGILIDATTVGLEFGFGWVKRREEGMRDEMGCFNDQL